MGNNGNGNICCCNLLYRQMVSIYCSVCVRIYSLGIRRETNDPAMAFGRQAMGNVIRRTDNVIIPCCDNYLVSHRLYRMNNAVYLRDIVF